MLYSEIIAVVRSIQIRQAMYVSRDTEARSPNHFCLGKVSITYSVCV